MKFSEIIEGTVAGDIAVHTKPLFCEKCGKELNESPVGAVGRTGAADAEAHVTPELKKEFRALVKKLGGLTVARTLLNTYAMQD